MAEGMPVPEWCEHVQAKNPEVGIEVGRPTLGDLKGVSWEELVEHIRAEDIEGNEAEILVGAWNLYHDAERSL